MGVAMLPARFSRAMMAFEPFEPHPHLAVALSGGGDSRALALLADEWAKAQGGKVTALIVDHGLRAESPREAADTLLWAFQHCMAAEVLQVHVTPRGNVQQAARQARYEALQSWCAAQGVLHLLVGHHADDAHETGVLRQARRQAGASDMALSACVYWSHMRVLRPLLCFSKTELLDWLRACGEPWLEDPSNTSTRFFRGRLRAGIVASPHITNTPQTRDPSAVLTLLASASGIHPGGFGWLVPSAFAMAEPMVAALALGRLLATVRGHYEAPRYVEVERLAVMMKDSAFSGATLHGCRLLPARAGRIYIIREKSAPLVSLRSGQRLRWDHRFDVMASSEGLSLRALGESGYRTLREEAYPFPPLPVALLQSLPSLWQLDRCRAVPHIEYGQSCANLGVFLEFSPRKPLF
jgi:tRNA(Ile)-lysidine synthase